MKQADMEWVCKHAGIVRVFTNETYKYGDPYEIALFFKVIERFDQPDSYGFLGTIEYMGLSDKLLLSQIREVKRVSVDNKWYPIFVRWKNKKKHIVKSKVR